MWNQADAAQWYQYASYHLDSLSQIDVEELYFIIL